MGRWNVENFFKTLKTSWQHGMAVISLKTSKKPQCKAKKQVFRFTLTGAVKTKTGCFWPCFKQSAVVVLKTFLSTSAPYLPPCPAPAYLSWGSTRHHPKISEWCLFLAVVKKRRITTALKSFQHCSDASGETLPGVGVVLHSKRRGDATCFLSAFVGRI